MLCASVINLDINIIKNETYKEDITRGEVKCGSIADNLACMDASYNNILPMKVDIKSAVQRTTF